MRRDLSPCSGVAGFERLVIIPCMTTKDMRSAVMSEMASKGVEKRHVGKTEKQISKYYSNLRKGRKVRKSAHAGR